MQPYFLDALIVLFGSHESVAGFEAIKPEIMLALPQLAPAFKYYFMEESLVSNNYTDKLLREFKRITENGRAPAVVIHYQPSGNITPGLFEQLEKSLDNFLEKTERLVYGSPGKMLAIVHDRDVSELNARIAELLPGVNTSVFRFPDLGTSIYSYI